MKKILYLSVLSVLTIFVAFSNETIVKAKSSNSSCTPPFKSVEEAVICSGGTYGVIDTSDPDAANNFMQMVNDNGLTNSDGGGDCWSMNIKPSVQISCKLSVNNDAYYYYEGKKGEDVTISVSSDEDRLSLSVLDANNNEIVSSDKNIINNKSNIRTNVVKKILPYTGKYTFQVIARGYDKMEGTPFTINLTSEKSKVQVDVRKDSLIEGKKYTVAELNQNQSTNSRKFLVSAYVLSIYKTPECPKDAYSCPISLSPNITIGDECNLANLANACGENKSDAILWLDYNKKNNFEVDHEIARKYEFEVGVKNMSSTNIPNNQFNLISIKSIDGVESTISTTTPDIEIPPVDIEQLPPSKTFFSRFSNWLKGLFR